MSAPKHLPKDGKGYSIRAQKNGKAAELYLYDVIDRWWGISAKQVVDDLKALGDIEKLTVRINSEGGQVFEGLAIYNLLKTHAADVTVYVDGMALSVASIIAMAGDKIVMAENAMMMIHDPVGVAFGDAEEMRSYAEVLDKLSGNLIATYADRTGQDTEKIAEMMADETWLDAAEAVDLGFADRVDKRLAVAACATPKTFDVPERFQARFQNQDPDPKEIPKMAEPQVTPDPKPVQSASYQDLKTAFPKASAEFLTSQLEAQATLDQARAAYQGQLEAQAEAAVKAKEEAEIKAAEAEKKLAARPPGVDPVGEGAGGASGAGANGDGASAFWAAVRKLEAAGMKRTKAVSAVVREHPDLQEAMIAEHNEAHPRGRRK